MSYPNKFKNRQLQDLRLGIKSSYNSIRNTIAFVYCLYIANDKKAVCNYGVAQNNRQILNEELHNKIVAFLNDRSISDRLSNSKLITAQIESIQVCLELVFGLARISINSDISNLSERTGGNRYPKSLAYSSNIRVLDDIISSYSENEIRSFLISWLKDEPSTIYSLEYKVRQLLTLFTEKCIFKMRFQSQTDLIFQQEGIYEILATGESSVKIADGEKVGTYRVFNSFINEDLHIFLVNKSGTLQLRPGICKDDFHAYLNEIKVSLDFNESRCLSENQNFEPSVLPDLSSIDRDYPLQQIFFGAPGTGKSHTIKQVCKNFPHFRITFHPDTDYAAFVGSYKPITVEEPVFTNIGTTAHPVVVDTVTGKQLTQKKITYNYVTQPFLKAYIKAWDEQKNENPQPVFLVIEEINRGNCAQIFGDIFQLLDRNESGYSDYPITTDSDLEKVLAKSFANLIIQNEEAINGIYEDDLISKVKAGTHLLLPNNLYIWATMNTSDQSLFPIDSAFKRRWDWKYIKISDSGMNYRIAVNEKEYDWWEFVQAINRKIEDEGTQEDKKLGYFFAKTTKGVDGRYIINADKFLSKVLFFLYNDVYKEFGYDDDMFKGENGNPMQFADYFDHLGNTVEPAVERFLRNLGLKPINGDVDDESTDMDGDAPVKSGYSARINGRKVGTITEALYQILSAVVESYTYDDLYQSVKDSLNREDDVMKTISSVDDYQKENRWYNNPLTTKDGISFVVTNQWKKDLVSQIESLASTLGVSYENLSE